MPGKVKTWSSRGGGGRNSSKEAPGRRQPCRKDSALALTGRCCRVPSSVPSMEAGLALTHRPSCGLGFRVCRGSSWH